MPHPHMQQSAVPRRANMNHTRVTFDETAESLGSDVFLDDATLAALPQTTPAGGRRVASWRDVVVAEKEDEARIAHGACRSTLDFVRWEHEYAHKDATSLATEGQRLRWIGNAHFSANNFARSAASYTRGAREADFSEKDTHLKHIFYTNRACSNLPLKNCTLALSDAQRAIEHRPDYVRAHIRKALALVGLDRPRDAADAVFACAKICADAEAQRSAAMGSTDVKGLGSAARHMTLSHTPALSSTCQQFTPAQAKAEAVMKDEERLYLCCVLHKAYPLPQEIAPAVEMLADIRLELVPQYAVACFHSLLYLITRDDVDPFLTKSALARVRDRKKRTHPSTFAHCDGGSSHEDTDEEGDGTGITRGALRNLTAHGRDVRDTSPHGEDRHSHSLTAESNGRDTASLTGRLLAFTRSNGHAIIELWAKRVTTLTAPHLAIRVVLTALYNLHCVFLPHEDSVAGLAKLDAFFLTDEELQRRDVDTLIRRKGAPTFTPGDHAEVRLTTTTPRYFEGYTPQKNNTTSEWWPCKVLQRGDSTYTVQAGGTTHCVPFDDLRPPPALQGPLAFNNTTGTSATHPTAPSPYAVDTAPPEVCVGDAVKVHLENDSKPCNVLAVNKEETVDVGTGLPLVSWSLEVVDGEGNVLVVPQSALGTLSAPPEAGEPPAGVSRQQWSANEFAEVLCEDSWLPCRILTVRLDRSIDVSMNGTLMNVTAPQLRPPHFPSSYYTDTTTARRREAMYLRGAPHMDWAEHDIAEVLLSLPDTSMWFLCIITAVDERIAVTLLRRTPAASSTTDFIGTRSGDSVRHEWMRADTLQGMGYDVLPGTVISVARSALRVPPYNTANNTVFAGRGPGQVRRAEEANARVVEAEQCAEALTDLEADAYDSEDEAVAGVAQGTQKPAGQPAAREVYERQCAFFLNDDDDDEEDENCPLALLQRRHSVMSHAHSEVDNVADLVAWRRCEARDGSTFYFNRATGQVVRTVEDIPTTTTDVAAADNVEQENHTTKVFIAANEDDNEVETDPAVLAALQRGEWVVLRNLRTGHKHYYCPATKHVTTDLRQELGIKRQECSPKNTKPPSGYRFLTLDPTPPPQPPPPPPREDSPELREVSQPADVVHNALGGDESAPRPSVSPERGYSEAVERAAGLFRPATPPAYLQEVAVTTPSEQFMTTVQTPTVHSEQHSVEWVDDEEESRAEDVSNVPDDHVVNPDVDIAVDTAADGAELDALRREQTAAMMRGDLAGVGMLSAQIDDKVTSSALNRSRRAQSIRSLQVPAIDLQATLKSLPSLLNAPENAAAGAGAGEGEGEGEADRVAPVAPSSSSRALPFSVGLTKANSQMSIASLLSQAASRSTAKSVRPKPFESSVSSLGLGSRTASLTSVRSIQDVMKGSQEVDSVIEGLSRSMLSKQG